LNEVLINENRPMELEGRSPLKKWLLVGLLFFLLIPGSLITWQFIPKSTYELPSNWDELPLEEKILGHWETVFNGAKNTLNLDGTYTNPVGRVSGNARYTIRDDIISFGYNGRIISSRIVFISPTEMIWRSVENNAIVARYQRDPISMPTSAEVLEQLVGAWQELEGEGYLNEEVRFQNVGTSLAVSPRIVGNEIEVTLTPEISYESPEGRGVIKVTHLSTTVRVPPGQSVEIGGSYGKSEFYDQFYRRESGEAVKFVLTPVILES